MYLNSPGKILIFFAALTGLFGFFSCGNREPVEVGVILPLSGSSMDIGEEVKRALIIAGDEVNQLGGINGREVVFHFEDCAMDPGLAIEKFQVLERDVSPLFYISAYSLISVELAAYAEKSGVVLGSVIVTSDRLTQGRDWVFRFYPGAEKELEPVRFIVETLKIKKMGLLYSDEEWGQRINAILTEEGKKLPGFEEFISRSYPLSTEDFSGVVSPFLETDGVYIIGFATHLVNSTAALREAGYEGEIIGPSTLGSPGVRETGAVDGVYFAAPRLYLEDYGFASKLKKEFSSRFGSELSHYGASGYDFFHLAAALLQEKEISRRAVRDVFDRGFSYAGVLGTVTLPPGERDIEFPLFPAQIREGEVRYLR